MKIKRSTSTRNSLIAFAGNLFVVVALASRALAVDSVQLINPLKPSISTIPALLTAIINIVMILMIPVIVFYIIYSGFKYVMARGNASQVEEASQSLLYAILGGVLILGAFAIANIIQSIVTAFQNTPTS